MNWLISIFTEHSDFQAIIILSLISAIGLVLGRIKIFGISLGVTFVFFVGILVGHLGISIDHQMLVYAESFGLVLFVYALGLQVGPGFFSSFRKGGIKLNVLALSLIFIGTLFAVLIAMLSNVSLPDMMGILCGATTNTPALGAVQQTLTQMNIPATSPALGCAIAYPLGVVGAIIAIAVIRKIFVKESDIVNSSNDDNDHTYIATFQIHNPGIFNKSIQEVAKISQVRFVISRLWRDGKVSIPTSDMILQKDDRILVITNDEDVESLTVLFGEQENTNWNKDDIDWNAIDSQLISQRILVTRHEINGKRLGDLRLRNNYGINISRVYRSGVQLLATSDLRLQMGDRLTVVGEKAAILNVEKVLGNAVKSLKEPNLVSIFVGIILGLMLGTIPIYFPRLDATIKLGLAGGPIIMGILVGTFGPRLHMITYTTHSANLMLRSLGLALFLACLGLDSGANFFETVFRAEGAVWVGIGFLLTVIPMLIVGVFALKVSKLDFGSISGMLAGGMANPMALNYANDTIPGDNSSVAYATVYPLSMFARVIIVQIVLIFLL